MVGSDRGKRKRIQRVVNLPDADRAEDRSPSRRSDPKSESYDVQSYVEHDYKVRLLDGLVDFHGRVKDRAGSMTSTMIFLWCTGTAMVPPSVTYGICHGAKASSVLTLWACGIVGFVFLVCSALVFLDARSARRAQLAASAPAKQNRTPEQRAVHKTSGPDKTQSKLRTKKPGPNKRTPRRRH